jgi:RHS repeat-associated protein
MLTIRRAQLSILERDAARRARSVLLSALIGHGLEVTDDPESSLLKLRDKAGGTAFLKAVSGGIEITSGEKGPAGEDRTHKLRYNENRQLKELTDPAGLSVVFDYDDRNRLAAIHRGSFGSFGFIYDAGDNLAGIRYPDKSLVRMNYDESGRLVESVDGNGCCREFAYASDGRLERMIGPRGEALSLEYRADGELATAETPVGNRHTYQDDVATSSVIVKVQATSDLDGREVVRIAADPESGRRSFTYPDGYFVHFDYENGRLVGAHNPESSIILRYCPAGLLEEEETVVSGESNPRTVRYQRNALGHLMAIETSGGGRIEYGRDQEHKLRSVRWLKNKKWESWEIVYNASGAIAAIRYPNGVDVQRECNPLGYPESQRVRLGDSEVMPERFWTYDARDRLATETSAGVVRRYFYDGEGRLLRVATDSTGASNAEWRLDLNGNAEKLNGRSCRYNLGDQLEFVDNEPFQYDLMGNLKEGIAPSGRIRCEYNSRGNLRKATVGGGETEFGYDPFGRRIWKRSGGETTSFIWAGQWLLSEIAEKRGVSRRRDYAVAAELGFPLAQRANGRTDFIHYGRRLEPVAMTDQGGALVWQAEWDALGYARIDPKWKADLAVRLQGQYFDRETGLHYSIARYYDPVLGRFLQRDPLGRQGGSWNEYIYCDGDPLNRSDPTGEFLPLVLGAAAIGAVIGGGVEAYKRYKTGQGFDPWKIGKEAAIGGAVAVVGTLAAVGAGVALGAAGASALAAAAGGGTAAVGAGVVLGAGGAVGAVSAAVETCANTIFHGELPSAAEVLESAKLGGAIGSATAGLGAIYANRARRAALAAQELQATELRMQRSALEVQEAELRARKVAEEAQASRKTGKPLEDPANCQNGCPVDSLSGDVIEWKTDFVLPGALELVLRRSYSSGLDYSGCFGPRWVSTFGQSIETSANTATFVAGDGRWVKFDLPKLASESWIASPDVGKTFLRRMADGFQIREPDRRVLSFATRLGSRWLLNEIKDPNGNWIRFTHTSTGALNRVEHSGGYKLSVQATPNQVQGICLLVDGGEPIELVRFGYDERGRLSEVIDGSGRPFRYWYDGNDRLKRWEDRKGTWNEYQYDASGRCVRATGRDGMYDYRFAYDPEKRTTVVTDSLGNIKKYLYDERMLPVEQTDARGNVTRTAWDHQSNKLEEWDSAGRGFKQEFDDKGNITLSRDGLGRTTRISYSALGLPESLTDAAGNVWKRQYDRRGNLIEAQGPDGATWRYERDSTGNLRRMVDPEGYAREFGHDSRGLLVWSADAKGNRTNFTRDALGRVINRRDPLGHETGYAYDILGKLAEVQLPDGNRQRWEYDPEGNMVRRIGPDGRASRYAYGVFDLLKEVEKPSGGKLKLLYDTEARLTHVSNEIGQAWTYQYNATGQVIRERDFHGRVQTFEYDVSGLCTSRVNALGEKIQMDYDAAGQLFAQRGSAESSFEYDALGQIRRATNGNSRSPAPRPVDVAIERDAYGRVLREVQNGHAIESQYNKRGLRVRRSVDGLVSHWEWDADGQLAALRLAEDERLEFAYDDAGREVERRRSGGLMVRQSYDAMDRLISQWAGMAGAGPISSAVVERAYRYNTNGDPVDIGDARWGAGTFDYDPDGRISRSEFPPGRKEEFRYDLAGNIVAAGDAIASSRTARPAVVTMTTRYYGSDGRLQRMGDTTYEWDLDGRLKEKRTGTARWRYEWTADGRLRSMRTPDNQRYSYEYDGFGRRTSKEGTGERTEFRWDGSVVAAATAGSGRSTEWLHQPGSFQPLAKREGCQIWQCLTDQVGTPRELLGRDGRVGWAGHPAVWGQTGGSQRIEADCPIRFQGQWLDAESGLHYNFHRHYDPEIGQYLSPDPIGLLGGTRSYGYVHNPLSWVDPLGLEGCYQGVKDASRYLRDLGAPRADRVQILQSFDVRTIAVEQAEKSTYGLRFHDFGNTANPMGQFLTDTFTPLTNPANLALPSQWNGMTGIAQWQIQPGTTIIRGQVAPQLQFGPQYIGGAPQIFVLQPWKYGTLVPPGGP